MRQPFFIVGLMSSVALGCGAVKSTYHLTQAEQAVTQAEGSEAPDYAAFEWTMTHEYILKAREEWSNSAFGEAEALAKTAAEWAVKAEEAAMKGQRYNQSENMGEIVPEEIDVNEPQPPDPFLETEERLELLDIDVDEEEE